MKILRTDLFRTKIEIGTELDTCYINLGEQILRNIKNEITLQYIDLASAVHVSALELRVQNTPFYDALIPSYNKNYHLIPTIGIDGLMDATVEQYLFDEITSDDVVSEIGLALAFDYAVSKMKPGVYYEQDLVKHLREMIPTAYDCILDIYEDVDIALEIFEVVPKKSSFDVDAEGHIKIEGGRFEAPLKIVILDAMSMEDIIKNLDTIRRLK